MPSKPKIATLLPVFVFVALSAPLGSTTTTSGAGANVSPYSGCLPTTLDGCVCSEGSDGTTITVSGIDGNIESCMTSLSDSGYTALYQLTVESHPDLNLTENIISGVMFESLYFYNTAIDQVDKDFMGNSRDSTKTLEFYSCPFQMGLPKINANVLQSLKFTDVSMDSNLTLPKDAFLGTPALEVRTEHNIFKTELVIYSSDETCILTVPRYAFSSLTRLQDVYLVHSLRLRWGAAHFTAPGLKHLRLGNSPSYTIDAGPGSFEGIPAGAEVVIVGQVTGGWQPSTFFNILRGGAFVKTLGTLDCDCDMAWIRYSSFMDQVDMTCESSGSLTISLSEHDLSYCKYYEDQSQKRNEL